MADLSGTTLPSFNPSGDHRVEHIKRVTEELIDYLRHMPDKPGDGRCVALAITNYEQACMWAVKSLFVDAPQ